MVKSTKYVVSGVTLVGAALTWVLGSWYCGISLEKQWPLGQNILQSKKSIVTIQSFDRGWFTSDVTVIVSLPGLPDSLTMKKSIQHGPIFIGDKPALGLARIAYQLSLPKAAENFTLPIIHAQSDILFNKNIRTHFIVPEQNFTYSVDDGKETLIWSNSQGHCELSADRHLFYCDNLNFRFNKQYDDTGLELYSLDNARLDLILREQTGYSLLLTASEFKYYDKSEVYIPELKFNVTMNAADMNQFKIGLSGAVSDTFEKPGVGFDLKTDLTFLNGLNFHSIFEKPNWLNDMMVRLTRSPYLLTVNNFSLQTSNDVFSSQGVINSVGTKANILSFNDWVDSLTADLNLKLPLSMSNRFNQFVSGYIAGYQSQQDPTVNPSSRRYLLQKNFQQQLDNAKTSPDAKEPYDLKVMLKHGELAYKVS